MNTVELHALATSELSPEIQMVILARSLYREGWADHIAGHVTVRTPATLYATPWEIAWPELMPDDILQLDEDGNVVAGRWKVSPGIQLHVELHKVHPEVAVTVHNHSQWATLWCDLHRVPPIYDQTSAKAYGTIAVYDEYDGSVDDPDNARRAAEALGDANYALLGNHGPMVIADSVRQAYVRCAHLEWRCRQAWHLEAIGGAQEMKPDVAEMIGKRSDVRGVYALWEAIIRQELRADPELASVVRSHVESLGVPA